MAATSLSTLGDRPNLTPDFFNTSEYQLQLKENFMIVFENREDLFPVSGSISILAESVTPPTTSVESIPVPYGNKNINIAGRKTFGTLSIVFRDVIAKDTEYYVTKWLESIVKTKTGERGQIGNDQGKDGYKVNLEIIPLDPNGSKGRPSLAKGVFPINVDWGNLSYTDTGIRTFTVEFAVDDYVRRDVYDEV